MSTDRTFYVGRTLDELEDAKLGMETLFHDLQAVMVSHRKRVDHDRVAEHEHVRSAVWAAADEVSGAIATINDVIASGATAEGAEELRDRQRLAASTRNSQI